jgi:multidrug efflux pump subunit AcrA (membrane-fusion protein)
MKADAVLDEATIGQIRKGMDAEVLIPVGFEHDVFKGRVAEIRSRSNGPFGSADVYIVSAEVDNPDLKLRSNMTVIVYFIEKHRDVLSVPRKAVFWQPPREATTPEARAAAEQITAGGNYGVIWVRAVDGQHLRPIEVTVKVGRSSEEHIEISGPQVKEGMEIIVGQRSATAKTPAAGTQGPE